MRQPHRMTGEEHRRQRHIQHKRRVIAASEATTHIGELRVDPRRLERSAGLAKQMRDRLRHLVGRLHTQHQLEAALPVVPRETGLRLKKHRIDRLRLEFAIQHQKIRIFGREFGPDPLAMDRGLGVGGLGILGGRRPYRKRRVLRPSRADPAGQDRRIDVRRVRRCTGHARKTIGAIGRHGDGAGFLAEPHERSIAQCEARLIEGVECLEDQQPDRLPQIERRFAKRTEQVAGIKFGNPGADPVEIGGSHYDRRLHRAAKPRKIHSEIDVCRIRRAYEHRVRCVGRPARKIGGTEIGCVKLRARYLGRAIDPARAIGGRVPACAPRKGRARGQGGGFRRPQTRQAERDAARRNPIQKFAPRRPHALTLFGTTSGRRWSQAPALA